MKDEAKIKEYIKEKFLNKKEDKIMLFNIIDKINEYEKYGKTISTNFYNQTQLQIIKENIDLNKNNILVCSGINSAERNILIIGENRSVTEHIALIQIQYKLFGEDNIIKHRDVLGSLLNLGINRNLIGDIWIEQSISYVLLKREVLDYIINNLKKIKNNSIKIIEININSIKYIEKEENKKEFLVSSMRIDNILSEYLKLSRSQVSKLINSKNIFINWIVEKNVSRIVKTEDIISIRGKGRIKIINQKGINKKEKIILQINEYI